MRDSFQQNSTRDAILDATDRLLAKRGFKKMTIDELAREVGIGKGSVYLHFTSKEEIALSHIDRVIERLKQRLREIAASDLPCEVRLRTMLIERVLFRFDSVQHYTQSINEMLSQVRPQLLDRRRRYFSEESRIFAAVVKEGGSDGRFAIEDVDETATTLLDATNSLLPYSLSANELGDRAEIAGKVSRVADMMLNGLIERQTNVSNNS